MKREKISINILLVDIAHIYVYWNLERNGFSFKAKWFFFQGEMVQQGGIERKNEKRKKYIYINKIY